MNAKTNKVLLIGWDAADWKLIHQLIDAGKMPNMARFVSEGVIGNLATLIPELSPMLWTSIATGKRPFKHGILGFTEPDPYNGGMRPITNLSRKSKAVWNILSQAGKKCIVVGWWPSHPAEPINGVMVSNHYQRAVAPHGKAWPVKPGTVHPERLIRNLAALRVHPQELDVGLIMNFVPKLTDIDQEKDHRIESLAKVIADCTTVNRAATAIMLHEPWDFAAIYYDAIDHFCHGFMNFHPPRLPWIHAKQFNLFKDVVTSGYIYHDILLGTLLENAGKDTTVMIVSDHGFHSDHLRPRHIPIEPAGPAVQHRPYGIFAVKGPGIKKDELIHGASLLDICPTILTLFGLPVGEDMDGKPLINIFDKPRRVETVPSWDTIPGNDGSHPAGTRIDPMEAEEAIAQLVDLGYIEKPDENKEKAEKDSIRELKYNLARSYIDADLQTKAIPVLEELIEQWPDEYRFGIQLISCYQTLGWHGKARAMLETIFERKKKNAKEASVELREFLKKNKGIPYAELSREDQRKLRKLRSQSSRSVFAMEYLMGSLLFEEGRDGDALEYLKKAEKADRKRPELYIKLGDVYLKMKRLKDAEQSFEKAISIDHENAKAYIGLCKTFLAMKQNLKAAEQALTAIGLLYHNPYGHFLLGIALHRTGRIAEAVDALKVAVLQNPNFPDAHKRLARIYKTRLGDNEMAERHMLLADKAEELYKKVKKGELDLSGIGSQAYDTPIPITDDEQSFTHIPDMSGVPFEPSKTVVIVTGLPRSGTSMMMQMLSAGGIPPLTDGIRTPDEDNKKGYFEYEKAKKLRADSSWLPEARGKVVKIVAQLLINLPEIEDINYRIVFIERNIEEVIPSQKAMLSRHGKDNPHRSAERLKRIFIQQVTQTKRMLAIRKIPSIFVDYNRTIANPEETASRLNDFFAGTLNETDMIRTVDPSLRRQKAFSKEVKI